MLTPAPEGHDARCRLIAAVRMVVRDRESANDQKPVGGAGVTGAFRVPLQHRVLDIAARRSQKIGLDDCVVGPGDEAWCISRHGRILLRASDSVEANLMTNS
jgi:hypothetical protein